MENTGLRSFFGRAATVRILTLPVTVGAGVLAAWVSVGYAGNDVYGAVLLITGFVQLLPFADLGTGAAVMSVMSDGSKTALEQLKVLVAAQRVLLAGAAIGCAIAVLFLIFGVWPPLLGAAALTAMPTAPLAASAFLLTFALSLLTQAGSRILIGRTKNDLAILISTIGPIVSLTFVVLCATFRGPVFLLALAPAAGMLFAGSVALALALRGTSLSMSSVFRNALAFRSYKAVRITNTATPMLAISIGLAVTFQADKLILSHFGTSAALAEFGVANQLYSQAWAAVASVLVVLWAIFNKARSSATGNTEYALYWSLLLRLAVVGLPTAVMFAVALFLLSAWISHGQQAASISLTAAFAFLFYFQIVHYPAGTFLTSARGLAFQAYCVIAMMVASVPLSILGVLALGASGPAWASVLCIVGFQLVPSVLYVRRLQKGGRGHDHEL